MQWYVSKKKRCCQHRWLSISESFFCIKPYCIIQSTIFHIHHLQHSTPDPICNALLKPPRHSNDGYPFLFGTFWIWYALRSSIVVLLVTLTALLEQLVSQSSQPFELVHPYWKAHAIFEWIICLKFFKQGSNDVQPRKGDEICEDVVIDWAGKRWRVW